MRGRKPKPTAVKRAAGNPGSRPLNDREPEPTAGIPPCPSQLGKIAKAEWRRIANELLDNGLLTQVDRAALAAYCMAFERMLRAEAEVQAYIRDPNNPDQSMMMPTKAGYIQHPAIGIANRAAELMKAYLVEFGLTPSSRSRIRVPKKPTVSRWDEFGRLASKAGPHKFRAV